MNACKVFVPRDSAALAVGADEVAKAFMDEAAARGLNIQVVRNSSRGMFWLETLVEVETPQGRVAYGPVQASDVKALLDAGLLEGQKHSLCHGLTEKIPYVAQQERLTFARMGVTEPLSLSDYKAHGGWAGLERAPVCLLQSWHGIRVPILRVGRLSQWTMPPVESSTRSLAGIRVHGIRGGGAGRRYRLG